MKPAEFEEKEYEGPLYNQLERGTFFLFLRNETAGLGAPNGALGLPTPAASPTLAKLCGARLASKPASF